MLSYNTLLIHNIVFFITLLISLEKEFQKRHRDSKIDQFVFGINCSQKEYRDLVNFYSSYPDKLNFIEKYPYCSLKLATESFIRVKDIDISDAVIETLKHRGLIYLDRKLIKLLESLNFKTLSKVENSYYIYNHLALHAGLPGIYFEKLLNHIRKEYIKNGNNTSRTIENIINVFSLESICKPIANYSNFFNAFSDISTKKALIQWLIEFINIERIDFQNINSDIEAKIPGYLFDFCNVQINRSNVKIIHKDFNTRTGSTGLFYDTIDQNIYFIVQNTFENKQRFTQKSDWEKIFLQNPRLMEIKLKLAPSDLKFILGTEQNLFLFDRNGNIVPNTKTKYIVNSSSQSVLFIISKKEISFTQNGINLFEVQTINIDWLQWRFYQLTLDPGTSISTGIFPQPYDNIEFITDFKLDDSTIEIPDNFIETNSKINIYGGALPPSKIIFHPSTGYDVDDYNVEINTGKTYYKSYNALSSVYITFRNTNLAYYDNYINFCFSFTNKITQETKKCEFIWIPGLEVRVNTKDIFSITKPILLTLKSSISLSVLHEQIPTEKTRYISLRLNFNERLTKIPVVINDIFFEIYIRHPNIFFWITTARLGDKQLIESGHMGKKININRLKEIIDNTDNLCRLYIEIDPLYVPSTSFLTLTNRANYEKPLFFENKIAELNLTELYNKGELYIQDRNTGRLVKFLAKEDKMYRKIFDYLMKKQYYKLRREQHANTKNYW